MISRGFEAVNTVFGGYFGFGKKKTRSLRERDVVKHGPYTALSLPVRDSGMGHVSVRHRLR
jgi:hypothetical protein